MYAELHCHSYYSFHDGASSLEELLVRAKELGYAALALTDHDNLCGAMRFAQLTHSLGIQGITGAELTLRACLVPDTGVGYHLTLLVKDREGYRNLCRLITAAHDAGERNAPELPVELLQNILRVWLSYPAARRGNWRGLSAEGIIRKRASLYGNIWNGSN